MQGPNQLSSRTELLWFIAPCEITENVWPWFRSEWHPNTHFLSHSVAIPGRLCSLQINLRHYIRNSVEDTQLQGCDSDHLSVHTHCPAEIKQTCIHTIHLFLTFISIINDKQIHSVKSSPRHSLIMGCIQSRRLKSNSYVNIYVGKVMCIQRYVYSVL